jgi:hypothetical protein
MVYYQASLFIEAGILFLYYKTRHPREIQRCRSSQIPYKELPTHLESLVSPYDQSLTADSQVRMSPFTVIASDSSALMQVLIAGSTD